MIDVQIEWEKEMVNRGKLRYIAQRDSAIEGKRASETTSGSHLMQMYLRQISEGLHIDVTKPGPKSKYAVVIREFDPNVLAYIALKVCMQCVYSHQISLVSLAGEIGRKIEDQFRLVKFQAKYPEYYEEIKRRMEHRAKGSYEYKRNSIYGSMRRQKLEEISYWPNDACIKIGLVLIRSVVQNSDLLLVVPGRGGPKGTPSMLKPTDACKKWVLEHDDAMALLFPDRMPCLIGPADWESATDGGYYSPELRGITPLVIRGRYPSAKKMKRYNEAVMPEVYAAVNALQGTRWRINQRVLTVMQEVWHKNLEIGMPRSEPYQFPPAPIKPEQKSSELTGAELQRFNEWKGETAALHWMETKRAAKLISVARTLRMAQEMKKHDGFYYVYRLDFRSRVYTATTGLSPQSNDNGKSLIEFGHGKALGPKGFFHLCTHGAGKYGFDKASADEQYEFINSRREQWQAVVNDPIGNRKYWQDADSPYQFLAFCFEYCDALVFGEAFKSHLPIARDGTCNGIQHFSAMLRDPIGGKSVNLIPADRPGDIYSDVARVFTAKLLHEVKCESPLRVVAKNWLGLFTKLGHDGAPRKLTKPPVMTLPYGSTQRTCTETTYEWYKDQKIEYFVKNESFKHAIVATPIMWKSIEEVVVAPRAIMALMQKWAWKITKWGMIDYLNPLGFPVIHDDHKLRTDQIETQLLGKIQLRIETPIKELDPYSAKNGVSPNFVHSLDAAHLMRTINAMHLAGIRSFAFIHDDFGCHAGDIDTMDRILREEFVRLYTECDPIMSFKLQHEAKYGVVLQDPPPMGTLDLELVKQSRYFFF